MGMNRRDFVQRAIVGGTAFAFLPNPERWAAAGVDDREIVGARIHPAIGVARVGNSEEFFIGPEVPGLDPDVSYKDGRHAVKRQAARFRLFGVNAAGEVVRELTEADADIEWTVHLAAKKASWYVWNTSMDIPEATTVPLRNPNMTDRGKLVIDGGERSIRPGDGRSPDFEGHFLEAPLYLGELRTDDAGRLLVLGGLGRSFSPTKKPIQPQVTNGGCGRSTCGDFEPTFGPSIDSDEWTDDMSDGPVTARVEFQGRPLPVTGAWVTVLPPNYAPRTLRPFRTLYDVITEVMVDEGYVERPKEVSFRAHILPVFTRLSDMQWVNEGQALDFGWGSPTDFHAEAMIHRLADASAANAGFRNNLFQRFRNPAYLEPEAGKLPFLLGDDNSNPSCSARQWLAVLPSTYEHLRQWARGEFVNDLEVEHEPQSLAELSPAHQAYALDRAALESVEGDAFHPAPELQFIMRVPSMYDGPYRIRRVDYGRIDWGPELTPEQALAPDGPLQGAGPGDLTRWGGVPWQLDVARCGGSYQEYVDMYGPSIWPMRAPNGVLREEDYRIVMDTSRPMEERQRAFFRRSEWLRAVRVPDPATAGANAVAQWAGLGFILPKPGPGDGGFPEIIYVESDIGFEEPDTSYRDVSIWIEQHLS